MSVCKCAVAYAQRGWLVLPLHTPRTQGCSCGKLRCTSPGKHPRTRNGLHDASTDERTIRAWWTECPNANIGVRTGAESGVIVLDVDGPAGMGSLADQPPLPPTPCSSTGRGHHFWFRHPGSHVSNRARLLPGVDLRGDGGYVVAPPSLHASGPRYRWIVAPDSVPLADAPAWVLAAPVPAAATPSIGGAVAPPGTTEPIPEGARNDTLYRHGRSLRCGGATPEEIATVLHAENAARCRPPLPATEVDAIARNAASQPDREGFNRPTQAVRRTPTDLDPAIAGYFAIYDGEVEDQWEWPR